MKLSGISFPKLIALFIVMSLVHAVIGVESDQLAVDSDRAQQAEDKPLKIFILAGQSNMQGHAHIRTIDAMGLNPDTASIMAEMCHEDGTPRVCDQVWISSIGSSDQEKHGQLTVGFGAQGRGPKIGPELTFGIYMQQLVDEPILIIKIAWGGKSLHTDFRPPSAGVYELNAAQIERLEKQGKDVDAHQKEAASKSGHHYRLMMNHVQHVLADIQRVYPSFEKEQGFQLAGFAWFQGWNDMVDSGVYPKRGQPGGYQDYSTLMAQFIRDVRNDLDAPDMPFVICAMGVGGPTEHYGPNQQREKRVHQTFRDAMAAPAALAEFKGNVDVVQTAAYWDMEVVALRKREETIKPQIELLKEQLKAGTLSQQQCDAAIAKLYATTFKPDERVVLQESVSNADYHYMGSARIIGQIGKAFAETLFGLMKSGDAK